MYMYGYIYIQNIWFPLLPSMLFSAWHARQLSVTAWLKDAIAPRAAWCAQLPTTIRMRTTNKIAQTQPPTINNHAFFYVSILKCKSINTK